MIKKTALEIDFHVINDKKGYIYNTNNTTHLYKFFIKKHNELCKQDPFEATPSFDKCELVDENELVQEERVKDLKPYIYNRVETSSTDGGYFTIYGELIKPVSKTYNSVTVECVQTNDLFLQELTEKVKRFKVE